MKNIAAQMVNFDREQMRRIANNMPEQYDEKPQVQQVAQIINGVFSQLLATFPASLATRKKSEIVYSGVSVTIPTAPTNLVSLLKTLTPSSGTLAPFFDTVNNKMVVFNENKTLFFKLSIVGTWPSGTANRSMQLTFSGSVPDTLVSSRNSATTTDNILLATFFSVDTLRKYQQANAVYADEAAKLKNTRLKNVLMKGDLTPEVVNNMLFSKNKSEIKTLYNSVGRVGRAQMRNGIIGKAMEKSGGSPDQFLRQLNVLQSQTGITFKGQDAAYLKGLKNYLQSTQQAAKAAVTTPTGQQTIPFIIGYGTAMNPATTGAAVSYGLLTRAYESEPFRNAMLRMANTPRGSTSFEKAMQQAQKAINAMAQGAKSDALSE